MLGQVSNSTELIGRLDEGDCDVVIVDCAMSRGGKYGDGLALLSHCRDDVIRICNWSSYHAEQSGSIRAILKQGINCIQQVRLTSHLLAAVSVVIRETSISRRRSGTSSSTRCFPRTTNG